MGLTESTVEEAALQWFEELGFVPHGLWGVDGMDFVDGGGRKRRHA